MTKQATNRVVIGATSEPAEAMVEDIRKLPSPERIFVMEDCAELLLPGQPH